MRFSLRLVFGIVTASAAVAYWIGIKVRDKQFHDTAVHQLETRGFLINQPTPRNSCIAHLDSSKWNPNDQSKRWLLSLGQFEHLTLSQSHLSEMQSKQLFAVPVKRLSLLGGVFSRSDAENLITTSSQILEQADSEYAAIPPQAIKVLSRASNLKHLTIRYCAGDESNLDGDLEITGFTSLETLAVEAPVPVTIQSLPYVRKIDVLSGSLSAERIGSVCLAECGRLHELRLCVTNRVGKDLLSRVAVQPQLQKLVLVNMRLTEADIEKLATMSALRILEFKSIQLDKRAVSAFGLLKFVEQIDADVDLHFDEIPKSEIEEIELRSEFVRAGLNGLRGCGQLRSLTLRVNFTSSSDLAALEKLNQLHSLDLSEATVKDKELTMTDLIREGDVRFLSNLTIAVDDLTDRERLERLPTTSVHTARRTEHLVVPLP